MTLFLCIFPGWVKGVLPLSLQAHAELYRIKLALVVGICGGIPFPFGNSQQTEMVLGDVVISNGVIEYDFGAQWMVSIGRAM